MPIHRPTPRPPLCMALAPLRPSMRPIVPAAPLSAPAVFVGTHDATRERVGTMPRTVAEAFGPGVSSTSVRHAESTDARATRAHTIANRVSAAIGVVVFVGLLLERAFS